MGKTLDPSQVYQRGLEEFDALSKEERLVFLLMDLETCMCMEGWEHFFTTDKVDHYAEMKAGLKAAGDRSSLEVIEDFEQHLRSNGVPMEADAIESWACAQGDDYFANCRDWREDFEELTEVRWKKIKASLKKHGINLLTGSSREK